MVTVTALQCAREHLLFQPVSFSLCQGSILQISGPNGIGKSTLLRCLAGLVEPYSGQAVCLSTPLFVGHKNAIKSSLTALENLKWLLGNEVKEQSLLAALEKMGLAEQGDRLAGSFSAGQRQRLALTRLALSSGGLWILDEPFTALDTSGIDLVHGLMRDHLERGGAVVLTSHQVLTQSFPRFQRLELEACVSDSAIDVI